MASNNDFSIDHYEEDGFLGAGGFATVYRYRFKGRRATAPPETARLPGRVAVKKLGEQNPLYSAREEEAFKECRHKNIVQFLGRIDRPNDPSHKVWFAMELCQTDLAAFVKSSRKLDEWEAAHFIRQALEALAFMHNKNYLHRDIKPSNILLQSSNNEAVDIKAANVKLFVVKLTDFGLARQVPLTSMTLTRAGTFGYMAPEVLLSGRYSKPADVYSVGFMTLDLLAKVSQELGRGGLSDTTGRAGLSSLEASKELMEFFELTLKKDQGKRATAEQLLAHKFITGGSIGLSRWLATMSYSISKKKSVTIKELLDRGGILQHYPQLQHQPRPQHQPQERKPKRAQAERKLTMRQRISTFSSHLSLKARKTGLDVWKWAQLEKNISLNVAATTWSFRILAQVIFTSWIGIFFSLAFFGEDPLLGRIILFVIFFLLFFAFLVALGTSISVASLAEVERRWSPSAALWSLLTAEGGNYALAAQAWVLLDPVANLPLVLVGRRDDVLPWVRLAYCVLLSSKLYDRAVDAVLSAPGFVAGLALDYVYGADVKVPPGFAATDTCALVPFWEEEAASMCAAIK